MLNPDARPYKLKSPSLPLFYPPAPPPPKMATVVPTLPPQLPPFGAFGPLFYHPFYPVTGHQYRRPCSVYYCPPPPLHFPTYASCTIAAENQIKSMEVKSGGISRRIFPARFKGSYRRPFWWGFQEKSSCRWIWRPKADKAEESGRSCSKLETADNLRSTPPTPTVVFNGCESILHGSTTVMIKNLPNKLSREMLLGLLDKHCAEENEKAQLGLDSCLSEYDFVYLPMDFWLGNNLGYAFVNFTSSVAAERFYKSFNNYKWNRFESKKVCEIRQAKIQGKEALLSRFRASNFACDTELFLPVLLSPPRNGSTSCPPPSVVGRLKTS
ncbi:PREDICTED: protein MEI2-like 7 [Nelumbo nucifera]|uniref:Protein MEI2-like 7 n=2 Tax=Nelumbo nucifera TaxID=4432 RepID=A0A1U7Z6I1_NELNU|nr:PREDICTED: protein MEI2-like 7 [Nelumbo nucifera]DAD24493.1 TPA_asm: hypothetical protein HUJ06_025957 [Nelumbo nucifera]